jgi:hypothetical protein
VVADSGVRRVVVATGDPNPLVNGNGLEMLRARGISVVTGTLEAEARALNAPFFSVMTRRRPFITMKVALSADHRIAIRPGVRTPLTGPAAARVIHRDRAEVDAVAVGSGTVLADDPVLTARGAFRYRHLFGHVRLAPAHSARGDLLDAAGRPGDGCVRLRASGRRIAPQRCCSRRGKSHGRRWCASHRAAQRLAKGVSSMIVEAGHRFTGRSVTPGSLIASRCT